MKFGTIDLKEIVQLMKDNDLSEFVLKNGKKVIKIKRKVQSVKSAGDRILKHDASHAVGEEDLIEISSQPQQSVPEDEHLYEVKTPLVGTFYRSPSPDDEPFVKIGDRVSGNDTLCIIEAMKSMNEIKADASGVVKEIVPQNGELVEFDQVLFRIEKSS